MKNVNEKIIEDKIKSIHGDKYLLDKFNYISYKEKVKLVCKEHGEFEISLNNLISNKRGCPICGKMKYKNSCRSNTKEFIIKANKIHKNKYLYNNVEYYNWQKKVLITCQEHGDFLQSPNTHLSGSGCPKCAKKHKNKEEIKNIKKENTRIIKQNEFIKFAKKIHYNKYDYSKVEYQRANKKVIIICNKHGEFEQTPHHHKNGNGCPSCSYENSFGQKMNTDQFISESIKRHGNLYDYSKSNYIGYKEKVTIICQKHGEFKQIPRYHVNGGGCPKCNIGKHGRGKGRGNNKLKYDNDEFKKNCNIKHNNKYDYTNTTYKGIKKQIIVNCKKHGEFSIQSYHHINGIGCQICSLESKKRLKEEFIREASEIHNNKYKYIIDNDRVSTLDKIRILCPEHGEFYQNVETHLRGSGCNLCKTKSRGEIMIKEILDQYNIKYFREKTFNDIENKRLRFDFWIPDLRTIIEFDGRHHFLSIEYFGGDNYLNLIKKNDDIKNKYCYDNNIKLIRINYKQIKNIKKIIEENVKLQT